MVRYGDSVEMDELLARLKKLRKRFPEEKEKASKQDISNFTELEDTFLRRSENVQVMLKQLGTRRSDTVGITAQIRTKRNIQQELQGMSETLKMMHQLIEKERKKKEKNKTKISEEEMQRRLANLNTFSIVFQKIQNQLLGERAEFGAAANVDRTAVTRDELFSGVSAFEIKKVGGSMASEAALRAGVGFDPALSGSSGGAGGGKAGGAGEYSQALEEIQKRDEEQDQIIVEIGELIMEAQQIAEAINVAVEKQNAELNELETNISETQDKLDTVNSKMKRTLEARGMSWTRVCMVFICICLVLGVVGVLVTSTGGF